MAKCLVPKTWATIPNVAGMVASHKKPKHIPKAIANVLEAGKNRKRIIVIPLKKYKPLNNIFLEYLSAKKPIVKVPKILNKPIKDKIAAPVHPSKPLSITYLGTCVATNVI